MTDAEKLIAIAHLCKRRAHPGADPGAHALANRVLAIIDPEGAHAAVVELTEPRQLGPIVEVGPQGPELTLAELLALDVSSDLPD